MTADVAPTGGYGGKSKETTCKAVLYPNSSNGKTAPNLALEESSKSPWEVAVENGSKSYLETNTMSDLNNFTITSRVMGKNHAQKHIEYLRGPGKQLAASM